MLLNTKNQCRTVKITIKLVSNHCSHAKLSKNDKNLLHRRFLDLLEAPEPHLQLCES